MSEPKPGPICYPHLAGAFGQMLENLAIDLESRRAPGSRSQQSLLDLATKIRHGIADAEERARRAEERFDAEDAERRARWAESGEVAQ